MVGATGSEKLRMHEPGLNGNNNKSRENREPQDPGQLRASIMYRALGLETKVGRTVRAK